MACSEPEWVATPPGCLDLGSLGEPESFPAVGEICRFSERREYQLHAQLHGVPEDIRPEIIQLLYERCAVSGCLRCRFHEEERRVGPDGTTRLSYFQAEGDADHFRSVRESRIGR